MVLLDHLKLFLWGVERKRIVRKRNQRLTERELVFCGRNHKPLQETKK